MALTTGPVFSIAANTTTDIKVAQGKRYALKVTGTWGASESLKVESTDTDGSNNLEFDHSPLTSDGGFELVAAGPMLRFTSADATSTLTAHLHAIYP